MLIHILNIQSTTQVLRAKYEFMYSVHGFQYIKPNMRRKDSGSWGRDWIGYMTPYGNYFNGTNIIPFNGCQVSLNLRNGQIVVSTSNPRPQYGWDGKYPDTIGGPIRFIESMDVALNTTKVDVLGILQSQVPLIDTHVLDRYISAGGYRI